MEERKHLFENGEKVRIIETGEIVTVDHWWFAKPTVDVRLFTAQYNIVEHPGTWFDERELEKIS